MGTENVKVTAVNMYNYKEGLRSPLFRYVDDTFALFDNVISATNLLQHLNICHNNIKFTIEFEENGEIPFFNVLVKRCPHNAFSTYIYREKTFTGLYTKWDSFTPRKYN